VEVTPTWMINRIAFGLWNSEPVPDEFDEFDEFDELLVPDELRIMKNLSFVVVLLAVLNVCSFSTSSVQSAENETSSTLRVHSVSPSAYSVPKAEGLTTRVLDGGKSLTVSSVDAETSLSIDLGSMPVQPGLVYRASLDVDAATLKGTAGVSLMIREHSAEGIAAFTPYHRTPLHTRPLASGEMGERELTVITGENTHALSVAIVVTELTGELRFSEFQLFLGTPSGKPMTHEQRMAQQGELMAEVRAAADARKPLTPRPLVFSRSQMKYPLGNNYYHEWNDRPLLVDRKYREASNYPTPLASYQRTLAEVVKYDIDGLAFFPETTRRIRMFEAQREAGFDKVGLLPEFIGTDDKQAFAAKLEILKTALKHPAVPRIDGKVLVTSYGAESLSPERWKNLLSGLRDEVGDRFIFLPSLANVGQLRKPFMEGEPITRSEVEEQQDYLRSYLDVCDGIYFNYPAAFKNPDHSFDDAFYRDIFIPVFKSVLSEPAYRKKYFGLSAYRSHMSPERGNSLHEDGTRTLRLSFEAAMSARPDVIVLPEWDEQNENTSFRPTVYGSRTTERIVRYYMSQIKGKVPSPLPDDDLGVPNLILSSRKVVTLGEQAIFELLNVPDTAEANAYSVELKLEDELGKVVHRFPAVEFAGDQLQEHRVHLSTEDFPQVLALIPTLTVKGFKGQDIEYRDGFHHVAVRATWNWDHLFVKQPLRDLLRPDEATFSWKDSGETGDSLILTGEVKASEPLSLIEVLGDDDEVYAYDPKDEFFRIDQDKARLIIEFRSINTQSIDGTLTLKNATADWFTNGGPLHHDAENPQKVTLIRPVSVHQRQIYLAIPKGDLASGELQFEFNRQSFSVPLQEVVDQEMVACGFDGGIHLSIRAFHRQFDMPESMAVGEASFEVDIAPEIATEQFHLRLTGASGKTYRSRPLTLPLVGAAGDKTLRIYSETKRRPIDVEVAEARIPSLKYDFTPDHGAVLLTHAGRPFWATLGGFSNSTTGRGTVNDLFGDQYPTKVERSDPAWVDDDGITCLEFDGKGTYLELPREAIPSRGAFTLRFDVKPKTVGDQSLLINGTVTRQYGLALEIQGGKLLASFRDAAWNSHRWPTELPVPAAVWSKILVRCDFERITLSVGEKSESYPLTHAASNIGFTVFGAGWKGEPFEGRLRNLEIKHHALP
jgi:hypothetical protein